MGRNLYVGSWLAGNDLGISTLRSAGLAVIFSPAAFVEIAFSSVEHWNFALGVTTPRFDRRAGLVPLQTPSTGSAKPWHLVTCVPHGHE